MSQENERAITADREGVIRHWGREAENVFGYTPDGKPQRQPRDWIERFRATMNQEG